MRIRSGNYGPVTGGALSSEDGKTALETLLVLFFVAALVLVSLDRFVLSVTSLKENALTIELSNLRSAVNFYAMVNRRLPASLEKLVEEEAVVVKEGVNGEKYEVTVAGSFVDGMTLDESGVPLDPFGNPYSYDPATGMVRSGTPGYESW